MRECERCGGRLRADTDGSVCEPCQSLQANSKPRPRRRTGARRTVSEVIDTPRLISPDTHRAKIAEARAVLREARDRRLDKIA